MSEELFYQNQLQDLEDIKAKYFSQLDEVEKKRAEITCKKEQIKADESLVIEEYHKIRDAKKMIAQEYEKLVAKNDELKLAKKEYEKKRVDFLKQETELEAWLNRYDLNYELLQKRKSEQYRVLRSQYEEELTLFKRQKRIARTKLRLDAKVRDIAIQKKEIASGEIDIEVESEKIERRREYTKYLHETLSSREKEFKSREKELSELQQKTEEEIGKQLTIHKQQLTIIKKDARIEQQLAYIKALEEDVHDLKYQLKNANEELSHLKIYSNIFEQNLELLVS
ncbi:hypothetical protein [Methanolobus psychrotolerans]|uniref:hypothetical protein n=1 Tax=Methanolobus psychrotolerans TaxID=1874706 RepID=UPI000B919138|nr:hypothetical protein [Methanolobus psychrotolerans]